MDKKQEVQMEALALQHYDEWLAAHMEELVSSYPSKVVAIHKDQIVFIGDAEAEVYQWVHKTALTPMPLVFRVPRAVDLDTIKERSPVPMQVFRYKSVQGRLAPIITIGIKLGEVWYPIGVYVDSGAAYTLLHAAVAQGAGFDYRTYTRP